MKQTYRTYSMIGFVLDGAAHSPWVRTYPRGPMSTSYMLQFAPQRPFKPHYLFLDGNLQRVWVESILVGQERCVQVAPGPLPASLFHLPGVNQLIEVIEERTTKTPMVRLMVERREDTPDWPLALDVRAAMPGLYLTIELRVDREWAPGERLAVTFAGTEPTDR